MIRHLFLLKKIKTIKKIKSQNRARKSKNEYCSFHRVSSYNEKCGNFIKQEKVVNLSKEKRDFGIKIRGIV